MVEAVGSSKKVGVNSDVPIGARLVPAVGAVVAAVAFVAGTNSGRMKACFIARPEQTYEVRVIADGSAWHIQVIDQSTTYEVQSPCKRAVSAR